MKKLVFISSLVLLSSTMNVAYADYDLLVKSNCLACHYIDKRKYGPKLNEVGAKYANDSNAVKKLTTKIRKGGSGVWGEDVMPPQPQLSEKDAQTLAKYILSLK